MIVDSPIVFHVITWIDGGVKCLPAPGGMAAAQTSIATVAPAQAACGQAQGTREEIKHTRDPGLETWRRLCNQIGA